MLSERSENFSGKLFGSAVLHFGFFLSVRRNHLLLQYHLGPYHGCDHSSHVSVCFYFCLEHLCGFYAMHCFVHGVVHCAGSVRDLMYGGLSRARI
ncbi:hypothetical protein AHF37_01802 [Paragonimus kellicotti]|nr:hypothetical protein AHF37_01802 [Paragonimus kellicotti]